MSSSTFAHWDETIHASPDQQKRIASAKTAALTPVTINISAKTGDFSGRHGVYKTTLESCSCVDFHSRKLPCKHMYRLAHELGEYHISEDVITSASAIVVPDEIVYDRNKHELTETFDSIPAEHHQSVLTVLLALEKMWRRSSLDIAIDYFIEKTKHLTMLPPHSSVVFTGDFKRCGRKELDLIASNCSLYLSGSVSRKTSALIIGENANSSKIEKAQELGVAVLTEDEFFRIIGE